MANASLTYRGNALLTTDTTTYTFSGSAIGNEHTYRAVLVFVTLSSLSGAQVPSGTIDTVTINGVAATQLGYATSNTNMATAAFIARVTTGTSVDIVVTTTSIMTRCHIVWYTLKTASLTPIDTVFCAAGSATDVNFTDVNIVNNGAVVVAMSLSATATQTVTYNGVDTLTSDYTSGLLDSSWYVASWSIRPTETIGTRDVFVSSASQRHYGIAVSFDVDASFTDSVNEVLGLSQVDEPAMKLAVAPTDSVVVLDSTRYTPEATITDTLTEMLGVGEFLISSIDMVLEDWFSVDGLAGLTVDGDLGDVVNISSLFQYGSGLTVADAVGVGEPAIAYYFVRGASISESVEVQDTAAPGLSFIAVVVDQPSIRSVLLVGVPVNVTETVAVAHALSVIRAMRMADSLSLTDVLLAGATFKLAQTDAIALSDQLRRFLSGDAVDTVAITESLVRKTNLVRSSADSIGISETLAKKFVVRVTAADTLSLSHTDALKMLFGATVLDGVEIAAAYISPGNSVTTWAVNTKTMATTEYTNYNFNSFAQMGSRYLGASSTGLYELDGDTDAGTNIIADIKSGLMQLGGSRFSSFKAAYIGMRGNGSFVLKVETGDGKTYNYAVVGKDMQTARVHFGKGLRARYFSFELISTGQDFDLDSIEFIPLVAQRRV